MFGTTAVSTVKADSHIPCRSFPFDLHSAAVFDSHIPWHGMCESVVCVNQIRPHCVNQMGKRQSKPLAERHGRGTAWYVWIRLYVSVKGIETWVTGGTAYDWRVVLVEEGDWSVWEGSMRMRGEVLDRKSIPKAHFIFYLFVYEHIIMLEKLNQVGLPTQLRDFIF
jgi:hypothetical protein